MCMTGLRFFSKLPVVVSGHTATAQKAKHGIDTVHLFRFCQAKNLPPGLRAAVVSHADPKSIVEDDDVVLLCKQYIHSATYSQAPQLFVKSTDLDQLRLSDLRMAPRVDFSDRQVKEFTRTAVHVARRPWLLDRAAAFLQNMAKGDSSGWKLPDIGWVIAPVRVPANVRAATLSADDLHFAGGKCW